jgi:hypothetical protein
VVFDEPRYIEAARHTARFILDEMKRPDGRLLRARRQGRGDTPGFCDDYAATAVGLFSLYQATGEEEWYREAAAITREMVELFRDESDGLFFATGKDAERLIARPKNLYDNPTPSDNSLAAEAMQYMAAYTGDTAWSARVDQLLIAAGGLIDRIPTAAGHLLSVALVQIAPPKEVAIVGPEPERLIDVVRARFRPEVFLAWAENGTDSIPLLAGRQALDSTATAYVCRGFVCDAPTTDPAVLDRVLP